MTRPVRVLVVDDSAYIRKVVKEMLTRQSSIEVVGTARDGEDALELVERLRPDVVTCDLIMPGVGGVEFIRRQVFDLAEELASKIVAAAEAPLGRLRDVVPAEPLPQVTSSGKYDVVVLGVSTGGPQGLKSVIPRLPAEFPVPLVIVLHMPIGYTEAYAKRLDELSALTVVEARDGEVLRPGLVLVAPAGRHLTLHRDGEGRTSVRLDVRPLDTPHRPSVDVLFQSAADVYGDRVLGVVMTGMGADGRDGAAWIKARGGAVLTEAEETCVVYGMPRSVVEAGLSDEAVPLDRMTAAIMQRV